VKQTLDYYQRKLKELYKSIPRKYPTECPSLKPIQGPLLISPTNEYVDSKRKIMIVGQETYGWYYYKDFCAGEMTVNDSMNYYDAFDFGFHKGKKKIYKSPFWNEFRRIEKCIFNTDHRTILWQNLIKFDYNNKSIFTAPPTVRTSLLETSEKLFKGDLDILRPDVLLLFTGVDSPYDYKIINKWFDGAKYNDISENRIRG
jgi:hypothetical protein